MAQNQQYAQYPYYAQPQNIYQQLGKPQPQPHLQTAYQQQQQQQIANVPQQQPYQYVYQQQPQQQPQTQPIQRVPSAHGFQQPQSSFPGVAGYAPQQQIAQQQVYQYAHPGAPAPTPVPQAPGIYQRPPSQNSRVPMSSFPSLHLGQPVPDVLSRQPSTGPTIGSASASGQLVPASQSLTLRGPSPAMPSVSPRPPISPSAVFAQQVQQQQQQQQQVPLTALVPANRNSMVAPVQRQVVVPPQTQPQTQPPPQMQPQFHPRPQPQPPQLSQPRPQPQPPPPLQPHHQPPSQSQLQQHQPLPPIQTQIQHQGQAQFPPQVPQQHPAQPQGFQPTKPSQRRPLPSPGASRPFSSVSAAVAAINSTPPSAIAHPARSNFAQRQVANISSQPSSPIKSGTSSPTKAPSSPTKSRPLPTPGGSSEGSNFTANGSSPSKEGFAGIGTTRSSARVTGLPVPSNITSLVAGIKPESLTILPLPEGSTGPEVDTQAIFHAGVDANGENPTKRTGSPAKATSSSDGGFLNQRRAASPPRFQPGATSSPSPTKETPPSSFPATSSSQNNTTSNTGSSPAKKFTPVWKRTIPDYPQPAFGYAAGMVSDPFAPTARSQPGPASSSPPKPAQTNPKSNQTEKERQRALVERELVERQLQTAMVQAHAQAHVQKAQPMSNTSYSAYEMYSRSNPNLHQKSSRHVRSGAHPGYVDDDEDDDEEEDEEEETEETEEEREVRRRRHGKKVSESTVTGGKAKKKKAGKEKKDVKRIKPAPAPRSTSVPPKKRMSRSYVPSTSEDETEATALTGEGETEEETYKRTTRHVKSSSTSSSRFKAKVEKEIQKKRRLSQYDRPDEYSDDDDDTPRKRDLRSNKRNESPPAQVPSQRQSHHQRNASSGLVRRRTPSPPPNDRAMRRASPPRVTLLKDAQRRTINLRGDDDDDEVDGGSRGRRDEVGKWKKDERYRSSEREPENYAMEPSKRRINNSQITYYEGDREFGRAQERNLRHNLIDAPSGQISNGSRGSHQHPVTSTRDIDKRAERWARDNRRGEQDPNANIFGLSRQDSPPRHPVRDSVFATGYRSRPASPTRDVQRQQYPNRDDSPGSPLMSPYRSRPSSPTRPIHDVRDNGLVTKFSAINIGETARESGRRGQGQWPTDSRLSRTPGEMSNSSNGGYFDAAERDMNSRTGPRAPTEFARISGRVTAINDHNSPYGGSAKPLRDAHNPHHHSNLNMNLDDPPPRSLSPAISQGSSAYGRDSESPQQLQYQHQPQFFDDRRPQSEAYTTSNSMQRRKSLYGDMSSNAPEPPSPVRQRPQSQAYSMQDQAPPPRPQSIHPFDRANMNKTNINNGTPKVQTIDIESPAPVGGRDKRADLDRMMSDPEDDDFPPTAPRTNVGRGFNEARNQRIEGPTRAPVIQVDEPRAPAIQVDSPRGPMIQIDSPRGPVITVDSPQRPLISVEPRTHNNHDGHSPPRVQVYEVPGISVAGPEFDDGTKSQRSSYVNTQQTRTQSQPGGRGGLICGGCDGPIIGRIVSAMGARWHPQCFKCTVCGQLLEHVSSYEHDGRPYCHLDYHENFAPRCFSCKTAIIEERFISLDDPGLGKRTYHEQHFFCAECGDPFLAPSMGNSSRTGELNVKGDGEFESDDVGFTVYKGHPYCEACHVRLRLPKCKKCKKSIRDHERAVEALGGKWCWGCFVCASCERPFENPSFFQRGDKPFCERCFDIMLRNEI